MPISLHLYGKKPITRLSVVIGSVVLMSSCGSGPGAATVHKPVKSITSPSTSVRQPSSTTSTSTTVPPGAMGLPLPVPDSLASFITPALAGEGTWNPAGRLVGGVPAVYETTLRAPGNSQPAGIAWMDTNLLAARLYSGSQSPGGGPYRYTAPVQPVQAASLVAAFNGGFIMGSAGGGYYTEGRTVVPLKPGAASLVIYFDGSIKIGAWGSEVTMDPNVRSVRQNLVPLVDGGQPTPQALSSDWQAWGFTCGITSCAPGSTGVEHQWRSGAGVTSSGALVYVTGPGLDPLQLAQLLIRAGAVGGMELDINPNWTVLATYNPPTPNGLAAPSNGSKLLSATVQGTATFFEAWWARDFVTMSARPLA